MHTGESIYQHYDQIITEYDVHNKITAVITDSAANMVKAFSLPRYATEEDDEDVKDEEEVEDEDEVDDLRIAFLT